MRHRTAVLVAVLWAIAAGTADAQSGEGQGGPTGRHGDARPSVEHGRGGPHHGHFPHHPLPRRGHGFYPPGYSFGSYSFGLGYYSYPPYHGYSSRFYYLPPVWMPAENLYGPQAMRRFMGVHEPRPAAPNVNIVVVPQRAKPRPNLRGTNRQSLDLASRFIGFGDAHFKNQKYADANNRYRTAVQVAPQLAEARFRQGYALMALGRYAAAAEAIKRGLALDPDWPKSNFRNGDLYGQNRMAKNAHLDAIAKEATDRPNDPDPLFLLGVFLHFDGQQQRAKAFFRRAAQVAGADNAHIRAFP